MARAGRCIVPVAVCLVTVSCSYSGGALDNPVSRSLTWYSYAGGDDLREACGPGARDRIRLIYNGVWDGYLTNASTQVRTYDVAAVLDGQGAVMNTRVFGYNDMSTFSINVTDPRVDDVFANWRGTRTEVLLSPREYQDLKRTLGDSGYFTAPPYGLRLPSNRFFWLVAGCVDGSFRLNGWLHPSDRFSRITFAAPLAAMDKTGIALSPPADVDRLPPMRDYPFAGGGAPMREPSFILQLGPDKLIN